MSDRLTSHFSVCSGRTCGFSRSALSSASTARGSRGPLERRFERAGSPSHISPAGRLRRPPLVGALSCALLTAVSIVRCELRPIALRFCASARASAASVRGACAGPTSSPAGGTAARRSGRTARPTAPARRAQRGAATDRGSCARAATIAYGRAEREGDRRQLDRRAEVAGRIGGEEEHAELQHRHRHRQRLHIAHRRAPSRRSSGRSSRAAGRPSRNRPGTARRTAASRPRAAAAARAACRRQDQISTAERRPTPRCRRS